MYTCWKWYSLLSEEGSINSLFLFITFLYFEISVVDCNYLKWSKTFETRVGLYDILDYYDIFSNIYNITNIRNIWLKSKRYRNPSNFILKLNSGLRLTYIALAQPPLTDSSQLLSVPTTISLDSECSRLTLVRLVRLVLTDSYKTLTDDDLTAIGVGKYTSLT